MGDSSFEVGMLERRDATILRIEPLLSGCGQL